MEPIIVMCILYVYLYFYHNYIKCLTIIEIDCLTEKYPIIDDSLRVEFDLNEYYYETDYYLVNHKINLSLPSNIFPDIQDLVSFEYNLLLVNINTKQQIEKTCIILINGV